MKRFKNWIMKIIIFVIMLFAIIGLLLLLSLQFSIKEEYNYYKNVNNYVYASGQLDNYRFYEDSLYISINDLNYEFSRNKFRLEGENVNLLKQRGFEQYMTPNVNIEIATAPRYFGNGYKMQIVALSIDGYTLLEFEEGYDNLMDWYENQ